MNHPAPVDAAKMSGISVRRLIDLRADTTPDAAFLIDPATGITTSYRELRDQCRAVAARIALHGVKPGEAVAYALTNGPASAMRRFLASCMAAIWPPPSIWWPAMTRFPTCWSHSSARLVLAQQHTRDPIAKALETRDDPPRTILVDDEFFKICHDAADLAPLSHDDDGLLMYTSGTTGRPKGVVLRQSSVLAGGLNAVWHIS